jgi:hypothetical protein
VDAKAKLTVKKNKALMIARPIATKSQMGGLNGALVGHFS